MLSSPVPGQLANGLQRELFEDFCESGRCGAIIDGLLDDWWTYRQAGLTWVGQADNFTMVRSIGPDLRPSAN